MNGRLLMYHGPITVNFTVKAAVDEAVTWARLNPTELILMYVTKCSSPQCYAETRAVMSSFGIVTINNCDRLDEFTLAQATQLARLPRGGLILAIENCVDERYDPRITCYGDLAPDRVNFTATEVPGKLTRRDDKTEPKRAWWWCYDPATRDIPLDSMWRYMRSSTSNLPSNGRLWMTQAHWQYNAEAIARGVLLASTILLDEMRSNLNFQVATKIRQREFRFLNLVEVDNVCNNGLVLLEALRSLA